jgi:hypothetical protein
VGSTLMDCLDQLREQRRKDAESKA